MSLVMFLRLLTLVNNLSKVGGSLAVSYFTGDFGDLDGIGIHAEVSMLRVSIMRLVTLMTLVTMVTLVHLMRLATFVTLMTLASLFTLVNNLSKQGR